MKLSEQIIEAAHRLGVVYMGMESIKQCGYYVGVGDDLKRQQHKYEKQLKELEDAIEHFIVSNEGE